MAKDKLDKETTKVLSDGEQIQDLVGTSGWKLAKQKLFDRLITLDSISGVPNSLPAEERLRQMDLRAGVVETILAWIRDVEGTAAQHTAHAEEMRDIRKESIVQFF